MTASDPSTRDPVLALLDLLDLLSNVSLAKASRCNTLGSHLWGHPYSRVASEASHLDWQEDQVDVFEAEIRSFRIIEIYDRTEERQQHHEDQVRAPSDAVDQDGAGKWYVSRQINAANIIN
jgi:hypothetical protein